uniref:Uncharacterized protein n=1 Tax=Anguilla anguilla TaxID=7936 RepID=A0A0E9UQF9_ANGAN
MFITIRILWERYVRIFWIVTSQTLEIFFFKYAQMFLLSHT